MLEAGWVFFPKFVQPCQGEPVLDIVELDQHSPVVQNYNAVNKWRILIQLGELRAIHR